MALYKQGRDPKVTNESCWKPVNDNLLPNPPQDTKHDDDKLYAKMTDEKRHTTKIIMAHEFRENPEGFKEIAQSVADAYNEANKLEVGKEIPEGSPLFSEEYLAREAGIPTGFKEEK